MGRYRVAARWARGGHQKARAAVVEWVSPLEMP
jgi:hypothetical protein